MFSQVDPFYLKAYADGQKAFAAGDFPAAAQGFEIAAFGLHADRNILAKAWGYLCVAAYKAGQIEKSREAAQKLELLTGATGLEGTGLGPEVMGDLRKLIKFFKEGLQPRGAASGDKTKVLPTVQASPKATGNPEDNLSLDREKNLTQAVRANPGNAALYLDLYDFYTIQKKAKEAQAILEKLVDKVPQEPKGHYLLGKICYSQAKFKDALNDFEKALLLTAKNPAAAPLALTSRGYLILCLSAFGRTKDVSQQCAEYRRAVPDGLTNDLDMPQRDKYRLAAILNQYQAPPPEEKKAPAAPAQKVEAPKPQPPPESATGQEPLPVPTTAQPPKDVALAYGVYDQYLQNNDLAAARRTLQTILQGHPQERRARFLLAKMDYQEGKYKEANDGFLAVLQAAGPTEKKDDYRAAAAAYLVLAADRERGLEAARSVAARYRDLLSGPALDSLSLEGSDKQRVRDLVEGRAITTAQARIVSAVLVKKSEEGLRVEVFYSPATAYRTFVLRPERKIIVDLFNVNQLRSDRIIPVNSMGLQSVRTGMFEKQTARVVLDIAGEIPAYDIQETPTGLVILVGKEPPAAAVPKN